MISVGINLSGKILASGGRDKSIKLWSLDSFDLIKNISGHHDYVSSVSFSPDGKTLATGSGDKTVKLWSLDTFAKIKTLKSHDG